MKFEELLRKSENKGHEEGLKEGLKEGRESGLKEGLKEGRESGLKEGHKSGLKEGTTLGQTQMLELITRMSADGRANELARLKDDPEFLEQMLVQYHIKS